MLSAEMNTASSSRTNPLPTVVYANGQMLPMCHGRMISPDGMRVQGETVDGVSVTVGRQMAGVASGKSVPPVGCWWMVTAMCDQPQQLLTELTSEAISNISKFAILTLFVDPANWNRMFKLMNKYPNLFEL